VPSRYRCRPHADQGSSRWLTGEVFRDTRDFGGTPGGTRTPNLLIRSQTEPIPARTTQSRHVMSCMNFQRSSSRLVPTSTAQSSGVGLHSGCNRSRPYVSLWAFDRIRCGDRCVCLCVWVRVPPGAPREPLSGMGFGLWAGPTGSGDRLPSDPLNNLRAQNPASASHSPACIRPECAAHGGFSENPTREQPVVTRRIVQRTLSLQSICHVRCLLRIW
jgi:hypothetical protein